MSHRYFQKTAHQFPEMDRILIEDRINRAAKLVDIPLDYREKVEKEAGGVVSSISNLETQYMNAKNSVNLDVAYANGFKDVDSPIFITRGGLGQANQPNHIQ